MRQNVFAAALVVLVAVAAVAVSLITPLSQAQSNPYAVGGELKVPQIQPSSSNTVVGLVAAAAVVIGILVASRLVK